MNVAEANAWHKVIRGLKAGASEEEREAGVEAAVLLNTRAYATLHAGPSSDIVANVVEGAQVLLAFVAARPRTLDGELA